VIASGVEVAVRVLLKVLGLGPTHYGRVVIEIADGKAHLLRLEQTRKLQ